MAWGNLSKNDNVQTPLSEYIQSINKQIIITSKNLSANYLKESIA